MQRAPAGEDVGQVVLRVVGGGERGLGHRAELFRREEFGAHLLTLLSLVESYAPRVNLTFEVEGNSMRFGSTTIGVEKASDLSELPTMFQDIPSIPVAADAARRGAKR